MNPLSSISRKRLIISLLLPHHPFPPWARDAAGSPIPKEKEGKKEKKKKKKGGKGGTGKARAQGGKGWWGEK